MARVRTRRVTWATGRLRIAARSAASACVDGLRATSHALAGRHLRHRPRWRDRRRRPRARRTRQRRGAAPARSVAVSPHGTWLRWPSFSGAPFDTAVDLYFPGTAPAEPVTLVSTDGRTQVAGTLTDAACEPAASDARYTGLGGGAHCLQLKGLHPGTEVSGQIAAPSVTLTVTVKPRDAWWLWPVVATILGLLLAFLAYLPSNDYFGRYRRVLVLHDLVDNNTTVTGLT